MLRTSGKKNIFVQKVTEFGAWWLTEGLIIFFSVHLDTSIVANFFSDTNLEGNKIKDLEKNILSDLNTTTTTTTMQLSPSTLSAGCSYYIFITACLPRNNNVAENRRALESSLERARVKLYRIGTVSAENKWRRQQLEYGRGRVLVNMGKDAGLAAAYL